MNSSLFKKVAAALLAAGLHAAYAEIDPVWGQEQIRAAVMHIVSTQLRDGEDAAISELQTCYARLKDGQKADMLSLCLARDIAYANLAAGMYRGPLSKAQQPEYSTIAAMKTRTYAESLRCGHSNAEAEALVREVAPIAIAALAPAIRVASQDSLSAKGSMIADPPLDGVGQQYDEVNKYQRREAMRRCNQEASDLRGESRKAYMRQCLAGAADRDSPAAAGRTDQSAPRAQGALGAVGTEKVMDVPAEVYVNEAGITLTLPGEWDANRISPHADTPKMDPSDPLYARWRREAIVGANGNLVTPGMNIVVFNVPEKASVMIASAALMQRRGWPFRDFLTTTKDGLTLRNSVGYLTEFSVADGVQMKALVVHSINHGRFVEVVLSATDEVFSQVESEFRSIVGSLRLVGTGGQDSSSLSYGEVR